MTEYQQKKTGTTILGIVAKDGIVLAADRRASLGGRIVGKKDEHKVVQILDNLALANAGNVSDIQLNIKILRAQLKLMHLRRGKPASVKEASNLLATMLFGNLRRSYFMLSIAEFLVAGYDENGPQLYEADPDGSLMLYKDYVCGGSGMLFATGVLEANFKPGLSIQDATKLAIQAVQAAIERDTGSGNGIDVLTITKAGVQKVYEKAVNMSIQ